MSSSHGTGSGGLSTNRLETLVDGVFAVVMTLLVLNLVVPREPARLSGAALSRHLIHDLLKLRFTLLSYAISFVVAGVYWVGHHNQFPLIRRSDRVLLWINILFLMCVACIPFSAALLAAYPGQRVAVVFYGSNLIVIGLALYAQWWYATSGHRLTDEHLDPLLVRRAARRILTGPVAYLLAIALSFIDPTVSLVIYALVPLLYILPGRLDRHLSTRGHDVMAIPEQHAPAPGSEQVDHLRSLPDPKEP